MKSLRIPENQIYNAYLIEGEDMAMIKAEAIAFAEKLLLLDPALEDRDNSVPIFEERNTSPNERKYVANENALCKCLKENNIQTWVMPYKHVVGGSNPPSPTSV